MVLFHTYSELSCGFGEAGRGSVIIILMSLTVAVDIGGTHLRHAVYEADSTKPIAHHRARSEANKPGVDDRRVKAIGSVWQKDKVTAIGMASPGPLDAYTGTILDTPLIH